MFSQSQLRLLAVLAVLFTVTQAKWLDMALAGRAASSKSSSGGDLLTSNTGLLSTAVSTSPTVSVKTTPSPLTTPSTTHPVVIPTTSPSSTPTPTSISSFSEASTSIPTSFAISPSSQVVQQTTTAPVVETTPVESAVTVVKTVSGSTYTYTTESQTSSATSSGSSKSTNPASLNDENGSSSRMTTKTKNTVIGVVVGIGGAVVLGGLLIVAWRIWGRGKRTDDDDGLMGFRSSAANDSHEKSGSASGTTPFQSTLENYHNPAKQVNASSNF